MKPCVCGGSNSNCRYCSGSGYVPDNKGLPQTQSELEKWLPESEAVKEQPLARKPLPGTRPRSFFSEMTGCLWWGLVLPILLGLLIALLMGKL